MRLFILFLFILAMFYQLGGWGVIDPTESRYAEIAREMYNSEDYLHPTYLGIQHYHKPPVTYYITCLAYFIFGINVFAARFFLQIALMFQIFLVYRICLDLFGSRRLGLFSMCIYTSFILVWISVKSLSSDAYLCTAVLIALWSIIRYAKTGKVIYLYILAAVSALGFMIKISAFLVFLLPIAVGVYLHFRDRWRWSVHMVPAFLVFIILGFVWFIQLEMEGKDVLEYMIIYQSVIRYATDEFRRNQPGYFYIGAVMILCFPWFLISLIAWVRNNPLKNVNPLYVFGVLFPILFFSFSHSKLILYILPVAPLVAIYSAYYLEKLYEREIRIWWWVQIAFSGLVIAFLFIYPLIMPDLESHLLIFICCGITLGLLILINIDTQTFLSRKLVLSSLITVLMINVIAGFFLKINEIDIQSARPLVKWLQSNHLAGRKIYIYNKIAPGVSFHLNKITIQLEDDTKQTLRETNFQSDKDWTHYYYDISKPAEIARLTESLKEPFVVLSRNPDFRNRYPAIMKYLKNQFRIGKWIVYY